MRNRINGNPAVAYRQGYKAGEHNGIFDGFTAFSLLAMIAGYNICDDYFVNDEQFVKYFKEWESEVIRIFREEYRDEPEAILFKADELRARYGMPTIGDDFKRND